MKVLDSSAIFRSDLNYSDGGYIITNGVLSEITDENVKAIIDLSLGRGYIKVSVPGEKSINAVINKAKETGDSSVLSAQDLEVLAAGYEKKASIVSDDYAIQNVAKALGLKVEETFHEGIKKQLTWEKACVGCGKKFPADYKGSCPVCGQKTKRRTAK